MKTFKHILVVIMIMMVTMASVQVEAQTKRSRSKGKSTTRIQKTAPLSSNNIISIIDEAAQHLSSECPKVMNDGLSVMESVTFKNKCLSMTFSYTDMALELSDDVFEGDYSYMDYNMKLVVSNMIKMSKVSVNSFSKAGISFSFIIKDNCGNVLWSKKITPSEYVKFYNELVRNGEMPSKEYPLNMESFRQMVRSWNASTPQDIGDGLIVFKISMEGKNINYDISTPYSIMLFFSAFDSEEKEEVRKETAQEVYDILNRLSSTKNKLINNMIKLGITVNYRYYAEDDTVPFTVIKMPASYIKRVGNMSH